MRMTRWLIAPLLGAGVAVAARRRDALSPSGALGAAVVGGAVYGAAGARGSALLLLFFGGSTSLSRLSKGRERTLTTESRDDGDDGDDGGDAGNGQPSFPRTERADDAGDGPRRTLTQVLANGGLPAALAVYGLARPSPGVVAAYGGALAAANADTWATEIGRLSPTAPRMITTGLPAQPGVSGTVTPLGTLASLAGAALIGLAWSALTRGAAPTGGLPPGAYRRASRRRSYLSYALRVTLAGCAGSLADSLLGATLQAVYVCRACGLRTEDRGHAHGGAPTLTRVRGLPFMTNDAVNLCASLTGALAARVVAAD